MEVVGILTKNALDQEVAQILNMMRIGPNIESARLVRHLQQKLPVGSNQKAAKAVGKATKARRATAKRRRT